MTVETLGPTVDDANYARTRAFYRAMGMLPLFETSPEKVGHPMLYMAKFL